MKDILIEFIHLINNNRRKFFGSFLGLLIGILILTIGFFKTIFIIFTTVVGYLLGSKSYSKMDLINLLEKILPSGKIR